MKSTWFLFFLLLQVQPFFYVIVNYDNINNDFVQPHQNFPMQFGIKCGSHYNALHFKRVIIYQRSHNLPINTDSPSHYLLGNFDWGDILGGPLLTVTAPIWQFNLSGLRLFATLLFVLLYSLKCCTVRKHLNNIYLKLRKLILRLIMIHVTLHVFTSL